MGFLTISGIYFKFYIKEFLQTKTFQKNIFRDGTLPSEVTIKEIMDTWTLQTGFPVLTVHRDYTDSTAIIKQVENCTYCTQGLYRQYSYNKTGRKLYCTVHRDYTGSTAIIKQVENCTVLYTGTIQTVQL